MGLKPNHVKFEPYSLNTIYQESGIVYSTRNNQKLTLSLLRPIQFKYDQECNLKLPLAIMVKGSAYTVPEYGNIISHCVEIARNGFIVAMINYGSVLDGNTFLDTCKDVKTAIRFLRLNADKYGIDSSKIYGWGTSSGANNVVFAGLTGDMQEYKTSEYPSQSDSLNAVVDCWGPSDILGFLSIPENMKPFSDYWKDNPPSMPIKKMAEEASTLNRVVSGRKDVPFLIVHGSLDPTVPVEQSENLFKLMKENDYDVSMYIVDGGGHSISFTDDVLSLGLSFLKKNL